MKKLYKVILLIVGGLAFSVASGFEFVNSWLNRRPAPVMDDVSCDALTRYCVGDFLYGWPVSFGRGFRRDVDMNWVAFALNSLVWISVFLLISWVLKKLLRSRSS